MCGKEQSVMSLNFHLHSYTYAYFSCLLSSAFLGRQECILVCVCVAEVFLALYFGIYLACWTRVRSISLEIWRNLKPLPCWSWNSCKEPLSFLGSRGICGATGREVQPAAQDRYLSFPFVSFPSLFQLETLTCKVCSLICTSTLGVVSEKRYPATI